MQPKSTRKAARTRGNSRRIERASCESSAEEAENYVSMCNLGGEEPHSESEKVGLIGEDCKLSHCNLRAIPTTRASTLQ